MNLNLMMFKGWGYISNVDEHKSIVIHWIGLFVNCDIVIYFDSLGVEHIPKN